MEKKELEKLISEIEKKAEKDRKKREYIVIAFFSVAFFLMYCLLEGTPDKIGEVAALLISSVFIAALHVAINQVIFEHLYQKDEAAQHELSALKKQLSDIHAKELDEYIEKHKRK